MNMLYVQPVASQLTEPEVPGVVVWACWSTVRAWPTAGLTICWAPLMAMELTLPERVAPSILISAVCIETVWVTTALAPAGLVLPGCAAGPPESSPPQPATETTPTRARAHARILNMKALLLVAADTLRP